MRLRLRKNFRKNQKFFKIPECSKSFPKVSKRVLNLFRGIVPKFFLPSVSWRVESYEMFQIKSKIFQNSKNAQNRSQKCPNVVSTWFGVIFSESFFAQSSMEGRLFEKFQNNPNLIKVPKMPKFFPKGVQTCFKHVFGVIFPKNFLPSVPWRVETSKNFKKNSTIRPLQY